MGMGELAPNFRNAETSKVFDFGTQWHSSCWKIHIFYELLIFSFGYKLMPRTADYTYMQPSWGAGYRLYPPWVVNTQHITPYP